jgi:serine/threonine protein kinase
MRPLFPGTSEIDQINKMAALLGPPTQWEEGSARMNQLNFRLAPPVGESTRVDENVESTLRSTMPRDTPSVVSPLIRQMIAWDPAARPVASIALQHEYFKPLHAPTSNVNTSTTYNAHSKLTPRMKQLLTKNHFEPPHCLGEIGNTEQSRKSNAALGSSKSKSSNLPMSNPTINQTENEFSRYLDAISNPISEAAQTVLGGRERVTGNKVRSFLHSEEGCSRNDVAPSTFQPGIDLSIPSIPNSYFANAATPSMRGGVERLTPHRSQLHKRTTTIEKPRWLISNQNISKRAMMVSITRQDLSSNYMEESRDDRSEADDSFNFLT